MFHCQHASDLITISDSDQTTNYVVDQTWNTRRYRRRAVDWCHSFFSNIIDIKSMFVYYIAHSKETIQLLWLSWLIRCFQVETNNSTKHTLPYITKQIQIDLFLNLGEVQHKPELMVSHITRQLQEFVYSTTFVGNYLRSWLPTRRVGQSQILAELGTCCIKGIPHNGYHNVSMAAEFITHNHCTV